MATRQLDAALRAMDELRYELTEKHVRAVLGDRTVADSTRAILVWEPRRVLPSYAVPAKDFDGELVPSAATPEDDEYPSEAPILHGGFPFGVHTAEGAALDVRTGGDTREGAAFRPADPDLAAYVLLDFHAFDAWYEEDEPVLGHPRSPFHRVDIRRSSRQVRIELDGEVLAESSQPHLVFETSLPVRFYLPRDDIRPALRPSGKRTLCAYKGEASYPLLEVNGTERDDLAWSYENPLPEAAALKGLVAFYDEKVDVFVDGQRRDGTQTGIAATIVEESAA